MIELERHIEILLLSNDCVIVPGLGGFMAHHMDARYDESEELFLPPYRTLGFNPQLVINDSLLVQSFIETYDISYPEALRRIESQVEELRQHLDNEGQYELNDIGTLKLNDEGNLEFTPCEAGTLTPSLYGLSSFEMPLLQKEESTEKTVAAETAKEKAVVKDLSHERAFIVKMSWLRNLAAAAAAIIAFFMIGTPVSNSEINDVQQSAFINISSNDNHAAATSDEGASSASNSGITVGPCADKAQPVEIEKPAAAPARHYCIVLASQVSRKNAENFVEQLKKQGFADAHIMETHMLRVVMGNYPTENEAYNSLQTLRGQSKHFRDAWVMKIEN